MSIEHEYFGVVGGAGGSSWSELIEFGDQEVEAVLRMDGENAREAALDTAAAVLVGLEGVDTEVREALVAELASTGSPTSLYLDHLSDELDAETIESALPRSSGDRQLDILRALTFERVELRPERAGRDEAFAELEYSFAADDTDTRLVVTLDSEIEIVDVSFDA
jgi:hypothetical protein